MPACWQLARCEENKRRAYYSVPVILILEQDIVPLLSARSFVVSKRDLFGILLVPTFFQAAIIVFCLLWVNTFFFNKEGRKE